MANGCTDRTGEIVSSYRKGKDRVHIVSIRIGDKGNAGTCSFTKPFRPAALAKTFIFNGRRRTRDSELFSAMARVLREEQQANAGGVPPAAGRSAARDRAEVLRDHSLVANLYALRGRPQSQPIAADRRYVS